jgi:glycosyltransferase involved in cell wall biosynthesis
VVVVNDNSTDKTEIVLAFAKNPFIISKQNFRSDTLPGSKVVKLSIKALETLDNNYIIIVKLDADLILPNNYFERVFLFFRKKDSKWEWLAVLTHRKKNDKQLDSRKLNR